MAKKVFALVMVISILGGILAGCSKPADDSTANGTGTSTTGTAGAGTDAGTTTK